MLNLRCMVQRVISVCDNGVILKPQQKLRFKIILKCLKKVIICEWPVLPYSFLPIGCSVIKTDRKTKNEISISKHKYLDNQTGDRLVKFMGFLNDLKVYNYDCSMS